MVESVFVNFSEDPNAPIVVFHAHNYEDRFDLRVALCKYEVPEYTLITITDVDWNSVLTPWKADALIKGQPSFGGNADRYLIRMLDYLLPETLKGLKLTPKALYIAGCSLAGLFSLYSLYRTDVFKGAACCSGSLWYPGFTDYVKNNEFKRQPEKLYLSLGDRESKTKNKVMASVEDNTKQIYEFYKQKGIDVEFEMNQGGHFDNPHDRLAKGIAYLLKDGN